MNEPADLRGPTTDKKSGRDPATLSKMLGRRLLAGFVVIVIALLLAGQIYVRHQRERLQHIANDRLIAIADLKQQQLTSWREERLADARFFSHAPFVADDLESLLQNPESERERTRVLRWLTLLKGGDRYHEVTLYDAQLRPVLRIPGQHTSKPDQALVEQAIKSREPVIGDLHRDSSGLIYVDTLFPIFRDADTREKILGFGLLKLDARQFLFPLLASWPTPSPTAETILIRREGDEVVYLNDLRFKSEAAMNLRLPIRTTELPAARFLRGETSTIDGIDYRGVRVVAIGRNVPGTSWAIIAKVDRDELYAALRREIFWASVVLAILLASGALLMALLWRQRGSEYLRRELVFQKDRLAERQTHERELERMNRLYAALSQVNQAIVRSRSRSELLQEVCRCVVEFGGFKMAWVGLVEPETKRVLPVAKFGQHLGYVDEIKVSVDENLPEGRGPIGNAVRSGKPSVCDLERDTCMEPWRRSLFSRGWKAVAAFPVREEGRPVAALAIYSCEADHFGPKEKDLLIEAANDISFGIDVLLNDDRRRDAEEALRKLNAELEQRVGQRTAALVAKNKELESFAYSVSHDLKAPLRGIAGFSRVLTEDYGDKLDDTGIIYLNRIMQSADHMGRLIEDLLSYSRLEIQEPQWSTVAIKSVVERILQDQETQIAEHNTHVTLDVQPIQLRTDPQGLELVLRNLIGNAIKFSAKKPDPRVEITGQAVGDVFQLKVRDNGIGFDMQYKAKVFQIFQRLQSSSEYPGTGIGLAIVRKAIQRAGGRVDAEGEPGKGACFWIELPLRNERS